MNEQPSELVAFLALTAFILTTGYFAICESKSPAKKKKTKDWMIPIGYVYNHEKPAKVTKVAKMVEVANPVKSKAIIFDDCMLALMATGYKKNDAKKISENIFKSHNPKTIEEFIRIAFTK